MAVKYRPTTTMMPAGFKPIDAGHDNKNKNQRKRKQNDKNARQKNFKRRYYTLGMTNNFC